MQMKVYLIWSKKGLTFPLQKGQLSEILKEYGYTGKEEEKPKATQKPEQVPTSSTCADHLHSSESRPLF
jgi:hypothetical protein